MSEIVLYDYWRSSASYRVRLALELKAIPFRSAPVNLVGSEQKGAEHLARNPSGAVPVLDIDGLRLTQSLAIIEYLEETRAGAHLLPSEPGERARARALALIIAADIHPLGNLSVLNRVSAMAGEDARLAWVRDYILQGLTAFEAMLASAPTKAFCCGDQPCLADICLVPQLYNARRWGVELGGLPRCIAIDDAFGEMAPYSAAHPDRHAPQPEPQ